MDTVELKPHTVKAVSWIAQQHPAFRDLLAAEHDVVFTAPKQMLADLASALSEETGISDEQVDKVRYFLTLCYLLGAQAKTEKPDKP
jgi:hypothetical protein